MFNPFKRVRCQCTFCNQTWRIPRRRILRFEKFFDIKKGQPFVWECHDCHEGVVIPVLIPELFEREFGYFFRIKICLQII